MIGINNFIHNVCTLHFQGNCGIRLLLIPVNWIVQRVFTAMKILHLSEVVRISWLLFTCLSLIIFVFYHPNSPCSYSLVKQQMINKFWIVWQHFFNLWRRLNCLHMYVCFDSKHIHVSIFFNHDISVHLLLLSWHIIQNCFHSYTIFTNEDQLRADMRVQEQSTTMASQYQ